MLPRQLGGVSAEVVEVMDDTHLRIKKEFPKKAVDGMRESSTAYKVGTQRGGVARGAGLLTGLFLPRPPAQMLPYVDQTKMYTSVYERLKEGGSIGIFPVS